MGDTTRGIFGGVKALVMAHAISLGMAALEKITRNIKKQLLVWN